MRSWADDHPKAKLMERKRASILNAARTAFLGSGLEGTSMEAIAAAAGVSIMTLYRHARTKDELFQAVVSEACAPAPGSDEARDVEAVLQRDLSEILALIAVRFQERLAAPETLGLLRAVMTERRQTHLGEMAYEGLIASHSRELADYLATRPEAGALGDNDRARLSASFFDGLLGADLVKALLGLAIASEEDRRARAAQAAQALMAGLEVMPKLARS